MVRELVVLLDWLPDASSTLIRFDPDTLPQTSWFRDDFADKSLAELVAPLRRKQLKVLAPTLDPASGVIIPAGGERIGLWVNVAEVQLETVQQSLNLWARILDSIGSYHNLLLGDLLNLPPDTSGAEVPDQPGGSGGRMDLRGNRPAR